MPYAKLHRAAVSAALIASALLGACNGGGDAQGGAVKADSLTQDSAGVATTQQTSTISIGLTGLILMLPVSNPAGTGLFMPREAADHVAYVGFVKADSTGCDEYNKDFKICFVKLENSTLEPIGVASGTSGSISARALNLTRNSGGKKGEAAKVAAKSRASVTLLSGSETDHCALAKWTIDPHPPGDSVDIIEPANVLTWEIPNFPGTELVLKRTGGLPPRSDTLRANEGRIELLIVHLPISEFSELRRAKPGSGPGNISGNVNRAEINKHLNLFYDAIEVPDTQRAFPSLVEPKGPLCPIRVLGLQNAVYPLLSDRDRKRWGRQSLPGIRTYSCIIGSAES